MTIGRHGDRRPRALGPHGTPQSSPGLAARALSALAASAVVAAAVVVSTALPAAASSNLSVSYPPDPLSVTPGTAATFTIQVADTGPAPLQVAITSNRVVLRNNGQTEFAPGPDPLFSHRISVSPDTLSLGAHQQLPVSITVDLPRRLAPDDYYLGFLVSPLIVSHQVRVVNDIGALVVLDVPGPRVERLAARYVGLPGFSLSASTSGQLEASNVGRSSLDFSSETTVSGTPSPSSHVALVINKALLLPAGLHRDLPIHVSSWLGLGWYHVHSTLYYNASSTHTATVSVSRTVILVAPPWIAVPFVIVGGVLLRRRWKHRHPRRRPAHSVKRSRHAPKRDARADDRTRRPPERAKHLVRS